MPASATRKASVLIVVLWIAIGLVSIALYFANSMTFELRAADNRASGLVSEQAIEGAARYVAAVLTAYATNGAVPDKTLFACEAVPVGDAHFWIIGRDPSGNTSSEPYYGLIDEGGKLNLNRAGTNTLTALYVGVPNMTADFALAITDWRSTNGTMSLDYSQYGYDAKHDAFETVDELRLVDGATMDVLVGDDINRNGVLDSNEKSGGLSDASSGLFEYLTVYTREPNYHSDGSSLTNVNTESDLRQELQTALGSTRAQQILTRLGFGQPGSPPPTFPSVLNFYLASGMTEDELGKIYDDITTTAATNQFIRGRVNVNTAGDTVLTALFIGTLGLDQNTAQGAADSLISYRSQHPYNITTIAWVVDALGNNSPVVRQLAQRDVVTTKSFQFTADIAAVGPFGRGYHRVKFVFDISEGTPKILYRQDLTRLGWALGDKARETYVAGNTP